MADWEQETPFLAKILMNIGHSGGPRQCTEQQISSKAMALLLWTEKVRENGDWDHKPIIANKFKNRVLSHQVQEFHILGDFVYFYDLWSNIHYGYVGTAAGFSESELLDGAGAEQIVSTLIKGKPPKKTARGLRGWDDIQDRTSVAIGIELYKKDAKTISELDLLKKIEQAGNQLNRRPYPKF